jgi:capsid portal protein
MKIKMDNQAKAEAKKYNKEFDGFVLIVDGQDKAFKTYGAAWHETMKAALSGKYYELFGYNKQYEGTQLYI